MGKEILSARLYRRFLLVTAAWEGERASSDSLIIKSHAKEGKRPFFWCGTPQDISGFIDVLGNERSIFCMSGTYGVLPPSKENVTALAQYYAAEIVSIQPEGPYLLGGYCDAAFIAYEIAKILTANGSEVGMLALVELDVADQSASLRIARKLFKLQQTIQLLVAQYVSKSNKWSFKVVSDFWRQVFGLIWDRKDSINEMPENPYIPMGFTGGVQLYYFKWGEMGFYQFGFFQRFWKRQALACPSFRLVTSGNHEKPSWHRLAEMVNGYLRQAGY